ncbi:MAG TPA: hypothetical protein VGB37_13030 [Candidatus Lokiarchaeia archaeon]
MTKLEYDCIIKEDSKRAKKGYLTYKERKILKFMRDNPDKFIKDESKIKSNTHPVIDTTKKTVQASVIPKQSKCLKCGIPLYSPKGTIQFYCSKKCRKLYRSENHVR